MNEDMTKSPDITHLSPAEAQTELTKREQAKISRREAFTRIGFKAGAAMVAARTADDLFRAVGREMLHRSGNSRIAQSVAQQFLNAGVAVAGGASGRPLCSDCQGNSNGGGTCGQTYCQYRDSCCDINRLSTEWYECIGRAKGYYGRCKTSSCTDSPVDCYCPDARC